MRDAEDTLLPPFDIYKVAKRLFSLLSSFRREEKFRDVRAWLRYALDARWRQAVTHTPE